MKATTTSLFLDLVGCWSKQSFWDFVQKSVALVRTREGIVCGRETFLLLLAMENCLVQLFFLNLLNNSKLIQHCWFMMDSSQELLLQQLPRSCFFVVVAGIVNQAVVWPRSRKMMHWLKNRLKLLWAQQRMKSQITAAILWVTCWGFEVVGCKFLTGFHMSSLSWSKSTVWAVSPELDIHSFIQGCLFTKELLLWLQTEVVALLSF